jgi:hypothetical protein
MILYNRIELESLTLMGMKLHLQARQSEYFRTTARLPSCILISLLLSPFKITGRTVAVGFVVQPFVSYPPLPFDASCHMMTIKINIRWKLPTETLGSSTIPNGYV